MGTEQNRMTIQAKLDTGCGIYSYRIDDISGKTALTEPFAPPTPPSEGQGPPKPPPGEAPGKKVSGPGIT